MFREVGPRVDRAAVVPHQKIARPPDMLIHEAAPLADLVKLLENRVALLRAEALDARRHQPVDEKAPPSRVRVCDEHRMVAVRDSTQIALVARLAIAVVFVDMERPLASQF